MGVKLNHQEKFDLIIYSMAWLLGGFLLWYGSSLIIDSTELTLLGLLGVIQVITGIYILLSATGHIIDLGLKIVSEAPK